MMIRLGSGQRWDQRPLDSPARSARNLLARVSNPPRYGSFISSEEGGWAGEGRGELHSAVLSLTGVQQRSCLLLPIVISQSVRVSVGRCSRRSIARRC